MSIFKNNSSEERKYYLLLNSITLIINWGIIGPGKIARKFATDLAGIPGAKIHAVASTSAARAQSFAAEFGAGHYYDSYEALVQCPDLHVVYIATPHAFHPQQVMICLEAGIPVLCEKPITLNAAQLRLLIETARRKNTFLMEALWSRFLPTITKVVELINSGVIGKVVTVKADFAFRSEYDALQRAYNPALGGGSLLDIGIYPLFLATLLLGKAQTIKAVAKLSPTGVDETCAALLHYPGGEIAVIDSSFAYKTPTEAYIYGDTGGCIHIHSRFHGPNKGFTLQVPGQDPVQYTYEWDNLGYRYEAIEVMNCLREGKKESDLWPLSASLLLMETMDEIRAQIGMRYPGE